MLALLHSLSRHGNSPKMMQRMPKLKSSDLVLHNPSRRAQLQHPEGCYLQSVAAYRRNLAAQLLQADTRSTNTLLVLWAETSQEVVMMSLGPAEGPVPPACTLAGKHR